MFFRDSATTLGIAPLTSTYFFGENQPHRTDFRPEVHDSDGLMVATGSGDDVLTETWSAVLPAL